MVNRAKSRVRPRDAHDFAIVNLAAELQQDAPPRSTSNCCLFSADPSSLSNFNVAARACRPRGIDHAEARGAGHTLCVDVLDAAAAPSTKT